LFFMLVQLFYIVNNTFENVQYNLKIQQIYSIKKLYET